MADGPSIYIQWTQTKTPKKMEEGQQKIHISKNSHVFIDVLEARKSVKILVVSELQDQVIWAMS